MAQYPADAPLSIAHLCELDVPPPRLIEMAARAGLDSVGFRTRPAAPGGPQYPLATAAEQAEIRSLTKATGVKVLYVELISLDESLDVSGCVPMLEAGAAIGASRLCVAGDSTDVAVVAEKLAAVADICRPLGIAVDLEFMPFRAVKSLSQAHDIVRKANRPNAHILVDALHIFRSHSALELFKSIDPGLIGTFQICDAPAKAPPPDKLVTEARTHRLLPGDGGLPLWPLIAALPAPVPIGVEVPMVALLPDVDPGERLKRLVAHTRAFLKQGSTT
jgi:sugar phosphate isomerase/epimerase